MAERKMLNQQQRARDYANRAHNGPSPTWDGNETRQMLEAAWLAGYRAAQRDARKEKK